MGAGLAHVTIELSRGVHACRKDLLPGDPTDNVEISAHFYAKVFDWKIRVRGDGEPAFDDATGAVSGAWMLGRPPAREPGMLVYVMVDRMDATLDAVSEAGGQTVTPRTALGPGGQAFVAFCDPSGNIVGLFQDRRAD